MRNKKGQSILEYVIVLSAIVAAVIAGALYFANKNDETKGVGLLMKKAGGTIEQAGDNIVNPTTGLKVK